MNDDGSYPPKVYIAKNVTWDYEVPDDVGDEPVVDLLYSKPFIYTPRNYLGPAFGYSEPTGPDQPNPGQYGLRVDGMNRAAVKKIITAKLAEWNANDYTLEGARPWK